MNDTLEPTSTEEAWTYTLDAAQLAGTVAKIAKINERADRKGLGGRLSLDVTKVERSERVDGFLREWTEFEVAITGEAPKVNGWEFLATLDWDQHAGLIVRAVPGASLVNRETLIEGYCDHCKTHRARNATYVLREEATGIQLQVGSTCIKDFLGWSTSVYFGADEIRSEGEGFFGARGEREYSPATVLAIAIACIHEHGWVPASSYDGEPTRSLVTRCLYPALTGKAAVEDRAFAAALATHVVESEAKAAQVLAFLASDDFNGASDYVVNLKAVAAGSLVSRRNLGLLVSAPQAYAKHLEKSLVREKVAVESNHVGTIGERVTAKVTVTKVTAIDGDYGTSYLVLMADEAGNVLKTFSSGEFGYDAEQGQEVTVKGTVKAHDEYNGTKQTTVTRVKKI